MKIRRTAAHSFRMAAAIALGFGSVAAAQAQDEVPGVAVTFSVLHYFSPLEGATLSGPLTSAGDGGYYGTTFYGGLYGSGTIYKLEADGTLAVLHDFDNAKGNYNGYYPTGGPLLDPQGNLYGTTMYGGEGGGFDCFVGCGVIYKLAPDGQYTVLYRFNIFGGGYIPYGGVLRDAQGNLFGTTNQDGQGGTAFMLTPSGNYTTLYDFFFGGASGPDGTLIQDPAGNFYGTTMNGGPSQGGVVYQLTPSGEFTVLHGFSAEYYGPKGGVVRDRKGNLYGVTAQGGSTACQPAGCGTVFKLAPDGTFTIIYRFKNPQDGFSPLSLVVDEATGALYGITKHGGASSSASACRDGCGTVFMISSRVGKKTLHNFRRIDGYSPTALIKGQGSELIGAALGGGRKGSGVIFRLQFSQ